MQAAKFQGVFVEGGSTKAQSLRCVRVHNLPPAFECVSESCMVVLQVKSEGMEILRQEERTLTKEEAAEFYKQHEGSEHFEDLVEFMSR